MDEGLDFTARNPVNTLNDVMRPREHEVAFKHKRSGPDHSLRWSAKVVISPPYLHGAGEIDYGFGWTDKYGTKKDAESQAAKSAVCILRRKAFSRFRKANEIAVDKACVIDDFADKICCICHEVEDLAERTMLEYYAKRKVLAAVVMETEYNGTQNEYKVISFGTGQKIIKQENLKTDGSAVLDCHAEVIARRGFKRYVFSELQKYIEADVNSHNELFEPAAPITDGSEKRYKVNDKIKFHLYISCPPCGDASVFRSISAKGKGLLYLNSKQRKQQEKQGLLRAKVADGEGTHPTDKAQDGRLRLMSCSDKILLWNMIGLQGALLSHFLEPIYLTSIVIGSQVGQQKEHLPRALYERKRHWMDFPAGYVNNKIDILVAKDGFIEKWDKNGNSLHSTNWCCGDDSVEIIDTKTGMVVDSFTGRHNEPSRLSKKALFNHFLQLRVSTTFSGMSCSEISYGKCKNGTPESSYVKCKQKAIGHVGRQGLGKWIKVDNSVDNFFPDITAC